MDFEHKINLTIKEAAEYTRLSTATLQRMRAKGVGAKYIKIGDGKNSKVLYPKAELDKFLSKHLQMTA